MLSYILILIINVSLYFGIVRENENILNVAVFAMWATAILYLLLMFTSEKELFKERKKNVVIRWINGLLIGMTVVHTVYWGYFFAPTVLFISVCVLTIRKYELDHRYD